MVKGQIGKIIPPEETEPTDNVADRLLLPTLHERTILYLRAVHGERDFTNEGYSTARGRILDVMADSIATESKGHSRDRDLLEMPGDIVPKNSNEHDRQRHRQSARMFHAFRAPTSASLPREGVQFGGALAGVDSVVGKFFFGRRFSKVLSVLVAVAIWYFFMQMRGWTPPVGEEVDYSTNVHRFLLGYLAVQLIVLIPTRGAGSTDEVWLDTLTSFLPLLLILYVLMLHWSNLERLPLEQLRYAKSTMGVMAIDFIVDFWLAVATQNQTKTISR
jgi:hypothetical protein